jgi:hypothetical protein
MDINGNVIEPPEPGEGGRRVMEPDTLKSIHDWVDAKLDERNDMPRDDPEKIKLQGKEKLELAALERVHAKSFHSVIELDIIEAAVEAVQHVHTDINQMISKTDAIAAVRSVSTNRVRQIVAERKPSGNTVGHRCNMCGTESWVDDVVDDDWRMVSGRWQHLCGDTGWATTTEVWSHK